MSSDFRGWPEPAPHLSVEDYWRLGSPVVPGWIVHPDVRPQAPSPWDDEFDAGTLQGKWRITNASYLSAWDVNQTRRSFLYAKHVSTGPGDQHVVFWQPAPTGYFTMMAHVGVVTYPVNFYRGAGIFVGAGSPGQCHNLIVGRFENAFYAGRSRLDASQILDWWGNQISPYPTNAYLRLVYDPQGWKWGLSQDGHGWLVIDVQSPAFAITSCGIVFGTYGALIYKSEMFVDWFRITVP